MLRRIALDNRRHSVVWIGIQHWLSNPIDELIVCEVASPKQVSFTNKKDQSEPNDRGVGDPSACHEQKAGSDNVDAAQCSTVPRRLVSKGVAVVPHSDHLQAEDGNNANLKAIAKKRSKKRI